MPSFNQSPTPGNEHTPLGAAPPAVPPTNPPPVAPVVPAPATPPAQATADRGADLLPEGVKPTAAGSMQVLTTAAYKRIKDTAKAKGRADAEAEFNSKLKELGFSSFDEVKTKLTAAPVAPATPPAAPPAHASRAKELEMQLAAAHEARIAAEEAAQAAQSERDAAAAEVALEREALSVGIRNVEFALYKIKNHMGQLTAGKSAEEAEKLLAAFNSKEFFAALKGTDPYIFDTVSRPATTGPTGGPPTSPRPAAVTHSTVEGNKPDVLKMNKRDYEQYRQSQGYKVTPF